jgi:hypothetical protein
MARPQFDPSMSDGCSVPEVLKRIVPRLDVLCSLCQSECLEHDEAYYYGGTFEEFQAANRRFYQAIKLKIGEHWATLWYGQVNLFGWNYWGTGRTWDGRAMWKGDPEAP